MSGCTSNTGTQTTEPVVQTQYVCPDGNIVSSASDCELGINDFYHDYIVATTHIHVSTRDIGLALSNLDLALSASSQPDYVYNDVVPFYDSGKGQATDGKELLLKARTILSRLNGTEPDDFIKVDLENRLKQVELLISYSDNSFNLLSYKSNELYEINYGSESEATRYFNLYNNLIPSSNSNLQELSDIQTEIDVHWEQDWYPTFQGTSI